MLISKNKILIQSQIVGLYRGNIFSTVTSKGYIAKIPIKDGKIDQDCLGVNLCNCLTSFGLKLLDAGISIDSDFGNYVRLYRVKN